MNNNKSFFINLILISIVLGDDIHVFYLIYFNAEAFTQP